VGGNFHSLCSGVKDSTFSRNPGAVSRLKKV
jgi:hypothetical protein